MKLSSIYLLFAVLLFAGCGAPKVDDLPEQTEEEEVWPLDQHVYVAGFEDVQDSPAAMLWKNGTVENLAARSTDNIIRSEARSVFVAGEDVYVAGNEFMNGGETIGRARLWKNGEIQPLANGNYAHEAFSVFVSGDDVYVLGRESLQSVPSSTGRWALKYWKNGEAVIFAQGDSNLQGHSIFVSDGDVYIAGSRPKPSGFNFLFYQAKLWKNGIEEDLSSGTTDSWAFSVFVSGNDVYVAGYTKDYPDKREIATLWKNGKAEELSDGIARSVYVSGNDVYVAGGDGSGAKLWKNGIVQDMVDDEARMFLSVFVSGNDVYTAGYTEIIEPGPLPESGYGHLKAALWKNGKKLTLDAAGKYNSSMAVSVFVK